MGSAPWNPRRDRASRDALCCWSELFPIPYSRGIRGIRFLSSVCGLQTFAGEHPITNSQAVLRAVQIRPEGLQ